MREPIKVDAALSRVFAVMSFVSAVLIVALHSLAADRAGLVVRAIYHFVGGSLCATAIPWFFFAAGFFVAGHMNENGWWKREVQKRVRTLLVPFWFWGFVIFVLHVVIALAIHHYGYNYRGEDAMEWISMDGFYRWVGVDIYKDMPTMWFMRTLFVLVFLSPIFGLLNRWWLGLFFVFYCWSSVNVPLGRELGKWGGNVLALRGVVYFMAGIMVRRQDVGLRWIHDWRGAATIVLAFVLVAVRLVFIETGHDVRLITILQVPPLLLLLWRICHCIKLPRWLTDMSFPIYVVHMMIVYCITGVLGVLGIGGDGNLTAWKGGLRFLLALILSVSICWLMRRFFPRVSHVVFGGR